MEQLETLKRRIASVQDLQSVVRTMKSLAAVNIHRFEKAAQAVAIYARTVEQGFQILLRSIPSSSVSALGAVEDECPCGLIVIGSHHGMCGQFNHQVATHALERLEELGIPRDHRRALSLGDRVRARLEEYGQRVGRTLSMAGSLSEVETVMNEVLLVIDTWREHEGVERILVFHNVPLSRATHAPALTHLFPLDDSWLLELRERRWPSRRLPTYTMQQSSLLAALTRQLFFVTLSRVLVESLAAENASRLAAMQAAEQNIEERLEELGTEFNRRRQTAITMELLDIVSGFEAIESN